MGVCRNATFEALLRTQVLCALEQHPSWLLGKQMCARGLQRRPPQAQQPSWAVGSDTMFTPDSSNVVHRVSLRLPFLPSSPAYKRQACLSRQRAAGAGLFEEAEQLGVIRELQEAREALHRRQREAIAELHAAAAAGDAAAFASALSSAWLVLSCPI